MAKRGIRLGDIHSATGSSYVELNGSKVFASVYGPIEPELKQDSLNAIIDCVIEYPFDPNFNLFEYQHKFLHIFSSSICNEFYFKTLIRISFTIISKGNSLTDAATLAGSLALLDAGIRMNDFVISCTLGLNEQGEFIPFYESDTKIRVALLPSKDEIVETEVTGIIDPKKILNAINKANDCCKELMQSVKKFLESQMIQNK